MDKIKIEKQDNNWILTLTIPQEKKRSNPYMREGEDCGSYPALTGLIDERMGEYGFAWTIDMDYKGKDDQYTSIFLEVSSFMRKIEFTKWCIKNNIAVI